MSLVVGSPPTGAASPPTRLGVATASPADAITTAAIGTPGAPAMVQTVAAVPSPSSPLQQTTQAGQTSAPAFRTMPVRLGIGDAHRAVVGGGGHSTPCRGAPRSPRHAPSVSWAPPSARNVASSPRRNASPRAAGAVGPHRTAVSAVATRPRSTTPDPLWRQRLAADQFWVPPRRDATQTPHPRSPRLLDSGPLLPSQGVPGRVGSPPTLARNTGGIAAATTWAAVVRTSPRVEQPLHAPLSSHSSKGSYLPPQSSAPPTAHVVDESCGQPSRAAAVPQPLLLGQQPLDDVRPQVGPQRLQPVQSHQPPSRVATEVVGVPMATARRASPPPTPSLPTRGASADVCTQTERCLSGQLPSRTIQGDGGCRERSITSIPNPCYPSVISELQALDAQEGKDPRQASQEEASPPAVEYIGSGKLCDDCDIKSLQRTIDLFSLPKPPEVSQLEIFPDEATLFSATACQRSKVTENTLQRCESVSLVSAPHESYCLGVTSPQQGGGGEYCYSGPGSNPPPSPQDGVAFLGASVTNPSSVPWCREESPCVVTSGWADHSTPKGRPRNASSSLQSPSSGLADMDRAFVNDVIIPDANATVQLLGPGDGCCGTGGRDEEGEETVKPLHPRVRGLPGNKLPVWEAKTEHSSTGVLRQMSVEAKVNKRVCRQGSASSVGRRRQAERVATTDVTQVLPSTALGDELAAAAAAVNPRDLADLRSFRNPPLVVSQVLEAVATLLGEHDTSWPRMRKLLDRDLLGRVRAFDPAHVTRAHAERLQALLQAPAFASGGLRDRCPPAVSLAAWCCAAALRLARCPPPPEPPSPPVPGGATRDAPPVDGGAADKAGASGADRQVWGLVVKPDLWSLSQDQLSRVRDLTLRREGVGAVTFHGETDCRNLLTCLGDMVSLEPGEVVVYPHAVTKPPVGHGLNKPATILLYGCFPASQPSCSERVKDRYKKRVKSMTEDKGAEFVDYDCERGIWEFRVNHF